MILFVNTYITEVSTQGQTKKTRPDNNNYEILKYMLASYVDIYPWKRVIIKIKLGPPYENKQEELNEFINSYYGKYDLIYQTTRNETQEDWIRDYDLLNDDLIWFQCNHDHPYIDTDIEYLYFLIAEMRKNPTMKSLRFSHWPEMLRFCTHSDAIVKHSVLENYALATGWWCDSHQVISKDVYHAWWCTHELPKNIIWGRSDSFGGYLSSFIPMPRFTIFIPYREMCRHLDGYIHNTFAGGETPPEICNFLDVPLNLRENPENAIERPSHFKKCISNYKNHKDNILDISEIKNILDYHYIEPEIISNVKKIYNL